MSHGNASLTPTGRLRLASCVVEDGWPLRWAAERFAVSVTTAQRWSARYLPPEQMAGAIIETTAEMLGRLNRRRLRVNPRVIRRKMSKWPLKRAHHRDLARPEAPPTETIVITGPSRPAPLDDKLEVWTRQSAFPSCDSNGRRLRP